MMYVAAVLIGYLLGLFQTGYLYGRVRGVDIRSGGSGNAGSTNALRTFGTAAGATVLVLDMLKCVLAVLLVWLLFGRRHAESDYVLRLLAALGCTLGHDFPFYMHFHGGKGAACLAGVSLTLSPFLAVLGLAIFFVIVALTHFVSLGSLAAGVFFLGGVLYLGQTGHFHTDSAHLAAVYVLAVCIVALLYFQHRGNIGRLARGEERKTYIFKKGGKA